LRLPLARIMLRRFIPAKPNSADESAAKSPMISFYLCSRNPSSGINKNAANRFASCPQVDRIKKFILSQSVKIFPENSYYHSARGFIKISDNSAAADNTFRSEFMSRPPFFRRSIATRIFIC